MNIKQAKEQIVNTVKSYLVKDEYGRYVIPQNKQRPIFLMGPPGIGKTEIMSQVASELGIGLLSYSMTHHTRQSALGLPIIRHKEYFGEEYDISEYTMSEIIASIYELMTNTSTENGILFLDEVNCVSETLNPIMLQFLQYKVFGGHRVPEGWIVVTAGNPPEYNNSVHEFDIVTWDRLKRIDVEPDFKVWKEFAYKVQVHASIMTYLDIKPQNFYKIETTVDGKSFVTARGWDDLSRMIKLYEQQNIPVDKALVEQYLQNKKIAGDFAIYYDLFKKYQSDYQIGDILNGNAAEEIKKRAKNAKFDERYSLIGLLLEAVGNEAKNIMEKENVLEQLVKLLRKFKTDVKKEDSETLFSRYIKDIKSERKKLKSAGSLSEEQDTVFAVKIAMLSEYKKQAVLGAEKPFEAVKKAFDKDVAGYHTDCDTAKKHFANMFHFCDGVFGADSQELLILVTELAANIYTAAYVAAHGSQEYHAHDKELLFHERNIELINSIEILNLEIE